MHILKKLRHSPAAAWSAAGAYALLIFYVSHQSRPFDLTIRVPYFDVAAHVAEYALLSFLVGRACRLSPRAGIKEEAVYIAVVVAALYGLTDELHQAVIPGRTSEWKDWVSDVTGAVLMQWAVWRRSKKKSLKTIYCNLKLDTLLVNK